MKRFFAIIVSLLTVSTFGNIPDENRLVFLADNGNAKATEFAYDGLGRLRERLDYESGMLTNAVVYVYDGMRVIQERDGFNTPLVSYTRGNDLSGSMEGAGGIGGLLARTDGDGSTFYHADGSGNITALMDGSQDLVASYRYDPFGNTISQDVEHAYRRICPACHFDLEHVWFMS